MQNQNYKNVILVLLLILLVICISFVFVNVVNIYMPSNNNGIAGNAKDEGLLNNNIITNNETKQEQVENIMNECEPFICFDDVSFVEKEGLAVKANKIDEGLRKALVLLSLDNNKAGKLTINDVDKLILHSLIINNVIGEDKHLLLEKGLDQAIVSASDYEKVFTDITGMKDVKSFYKGYDLKTKKDANKSVYYEENGKTYYIVPFGIGMETGLSVISDVIEKEEKTELVIKTYDVDYENEKYTHIKTTTFEIATNGLRVYDFNTKKEK